MINKIQMHGVSCAIIWIDFLISAERMYYKSFIWGILLGTLYTIWSLFFEFFINENENGDPWLYETYNWSEGWQEPLMMYFISLGAIIVVTVIAAFIKNLILMCSEIGKMKVLVNKKDELKDEAMGLDVPLQSDKEYNDV